MVHEVAEVLGALGLVHRTIAMRVLEVLDKVALEPIHGLICIDMNQETNKIRGGETRNKYALTLGLDVLGASRSNLSELRRAVRPWRGPL